MQLFRTPQNIRLCLHDMAADRAQIMQHLRAAGIPLVPRPVMDFLVAHPDPVPMIKEMKVPELMAWQ